MEGIELLKKIRELEKTILELEMMEDEAQNYAVKMKEENKRLREALEEIANGHLQELVSEQIAKLALEGSWESE